METEIRVKIEDTSLSLGQSRKCSCPAVQLQFCRKAARGPLPLDRPLKMPWRWRPGRFYYHAQETRGSICHLVLFSDPHEERDVSSLTKQCTYVLRGFWTILFWIFFWIWYLKITTITSRLCNKTPGSPQVPGSKYVIKDNKISVGDSRADPQESVIFARLDNQRPGAHTSHPWFLCQGLSNLFTHKLQ